MLLLFLVIFCASMTGLSGMGIPSHIPPRAGYECKDGKRYFAQTPRDTVINHLLSIPTLVPQMAQGNTLLHLAATITEMPDLVQVLVQRNPELATQLSVKNDAGQTPLDIQATSQKLANSTLKPYPSDYESEDARATRTPKRFTLAQLQAITEKRYKQAPILGAAIPTSPVVAILPDKAAVTSAVSKIERIAVSDTPSRMFTDKEKISLLATLSRATDQNNIHRASGLHMADEPSPDCSGTQGIH